LLKPLLFASSSIMVATNGEVLAEPLFWFREGGQAFACFPPGLPRIHELHKLEDAGIKLIKPGEEISGKKA
jgi:hypothetical protein